MTYSIKNTLPGKLGNSVGGNNWAGQPKLERARSNLSACIHERPKQGPNTYGESRCRGRRTSEFLSLCSSRVQIYASPHPLEARVLDKSSIHSTIKNPQSYHPSNRARLTSQSTTEKQSYRSSEYTRQKDIPSLLGFFGRRVHKIPDIPSSAPIFLKSWGQKMFMLSLIG